MMLHSRSILAPLALLGFVSGACDDPSVEMFFDESDAGSAEFRDTAYAEDPALEGPHCTMWEDFDRPATRTEPAIEGRIFWPVDCVAGMPIMNTPLVVFHEGNGGFPVYYDKETFGPLGEHLASHGFAFAVVDYVIGGPSVAQIHARAQASVDYMLHVFDQWHSAYALDSQSIVMAGLSQGGEAAIVAAKKVVQQALPYEVRGVVSLAPTHVESTSLSYEESPFFMGIYGSNDEDVSGFLLEDPAAEPQEPQSTVFAHYDEFGAEASPIFWSSITKSMKFVHGWNHNRFSANPGDGPSPQMLATAGYINAALRWQLWGQDEFEPWVVDNLLPPSADDGKWTPYTQYQSGLWQSRRVIDNFEGATLETSTIGGAVSVFGAGDVDYGESAFTVDQSVPHGNTQVLVMEPVAFGEHIVWEIPANVQDMSHYEVLSIRAGKIVDYGQPGSVSLTFRLKADGVWSDFIDTAEYTEIPEPDPVYISFPKDPPWHGMYTKSPMVTVRIPLDDFDVDPTQVEEIEMHYAGFNEIGTRWMIDNLEFSK